jgi:hypothetical protein
LAGVDSLGCAAGDQCAAKVNICKQNPGAAAYNTASGHDLRLRLFCTAAAYWQKIVVPPLIMTRLTAASQVFNCLHTVRPMCMDI